jgi:tRNA pseudouridine55 synthase
MDGILIVDKPQGFTSHDVVDFIRKRFGFKKAGHAGTLDPMATGLLVILIGKYTKTSSAFLNENKEYDATLVLGATSDTGDAWGNILPRPNSGKISRKDIEDVFSKFLGPIDQIPPSYSAKKFKGKKLYELARIGIELKLEPRKVFINSLRILDIKIPEVSFKIACSKGTYVRQLCADIGAALGCGAYLSKLRRTRSGFFCIDMAVSVEELKSMDICSLKERLKTL